MTTPTQSAPINNNTGSFEKLLADTAELGKQAGLGKDTQIKFFLKVVEASFHGVIDLTPGKHGADSDDAVKLTEQYVKAQGSALIFDAKADNQRKAISLTRTAIKGGQWTKGGTGEPLQTVNNLITMRQKERANPANASLLDDATNTLMKFIRTLLKRDQLPTDAELKSFCFRKAHDLATVEDILTSIRKQANALKDGKASHGTVKDASSEVQDIINACTKRLIQIAKDKGKAKAA